MRNDIHPQKLIYKIDKRIKKYKLGGLKKLTSKRIKGSSFNFKGLLKVSQPWKVLIILSCLATMAMYAETMLIPAIPTLINDFDVSYGLSSWILTSYLIAGAVMTPIAGKLSDIYGRKKILIIIMAIYTVGVSLGGFAGDFLTMIIARTIQGIGLGMFPIAFSIIRDQFPRERISITTGIITSMFAAGSVIGLSVGALIIHEFGWKMTFFTIIPISIMLLLMIRKYIHVSDDNNLEEKTEKQNQRTKLQNNSTNKIPNKKQMIYSQIDISGSILLAITIVTFLLSLTYLQTSPDETASNFSGDVTTSTYSSLEQIAPFLAIGATSLFFFVYLERRIKYPLIDFKIFLRPPILLSNMIIMIVGLSMFMVFQTIPILVQSPEPIGFGENAVNTGKIQLPFALVLLIFGPTSGFIISKLGSIKPIILGTVLTATGFSMLLFFHSTELSISIGLAVLSTGLSLASVGAVNVTLLATPIELTGVTMGISTMLRIVGSSIGPTLAAMYMQTNQSLINIKGNTESLPSSFSFDLIFLSALVFSIAAIGMSIVLSKKIHAKPYLQ
ncbi:MFS transporter [Candidatus Nitrosocosmicus arcticus]|uniref:MFS family permease n=1 Tax=Candidatus Nitrosocosmicus arcticus TaxID=2035267 RepID=A0A557STK8_9ARCH|nr:MFS transporter [Candidatus Nitrosocosmicus arcticus]TVP39947.1 MFS family permease [Candidatus Nitrosocosmicus arcticus]